MKGNSSQRMSISKCLVFEKVPPEKWRYVCRFRKSGINTKCNRLLWGGTYMYQNETWFLRNLHPSSFFWKRSHVKIEGSGVSRAPYVGWRISAGLIDNSRFRVTGVTGIFFLFLCWDIVISDLHANFYEICTSSSRDIDIPCLGSINKLNIREFLCSPLYPEWVNLRANPFGVQTLS